MLAVLLFYACPVKDAALYQLQRCLHDADVPRADKLAVVEHLAARAAETVALDVLRWSLFVSDREVHDRVAAALRDAKALPPEAVRWLPDAAGLQRTIRALARRQKDKEDEKLYGLVTPDDCGLASVEAGGALRVECHLMKCRRACQGEDVIDLVLHVTAKGTAVVDAKHHHRDSGACGECQLNE